MTDQRSDLFSEKSELRRDLGLFDTTTVVAGLVIGSGIFLTTGGIAERLPDPGWILLVWLGGGVLSLAGALTLAELGALMPKAGGQYVFLRQAFGDLVGFLFGWTLLLVIQSGSIAAVAVGFAEYFNYFVPQLPKLAVALAVIGLLSWVNHRGVRQSSRVQNLSTVLKVVAMLGIGLAGLWVLHGPGGSKVAEPISFSLPPPGVWSAFGVALIAVLWTFDGWNCVSFNAGEIRNPRRNLPLGLFFGMLIVTALYALLNYVYVSAIPIDQLRGLVRVAEQAVSNLFGPTAAVLVVATVLASTFGSVNAMILSAPRVYFAMGRDGLFFSALARVHPTYGTPSNAVWAQSIWAGALALSGSYDQLFTMVMIAQLGFHGLTTLSLFVFRRKYRDIERPYKVWGYPVTPLLFLAVVTIIIINSFIERPWESVAGCGIVATGVPAYLYWKKRP